MANDLQAARGGSGSEKGFWNSSVLMAFGGNFYALARHAIRTGKPDLALDYLQRSFDAHQYQITWLAVDPYFDPVRSHRSFKALIDSVGLE